LNVSPGTRRGFTKRFDIFHLDGERGLRGGERQLLYLAAALRARGHRNVVVCRGGALEREARRLGLETRRLPFLCEWDPLSALLLRRLAAGSPHPIFHSHTGHAAGLARLASAAGGPPVAAHRRVDFPLSGGLSRQFKYDHAGRVVAVSRAIAAILEDDGLPQDHVVVVPDGLPVTAEESSWAGVASDYFQPPAPSEKRRLRAALAEEFDLDPAAPWIGNLAALVPHKDHDTLIAAALIVLLKKPEALFLIAGEGPEEKRLLASIKRMGLLGRVLLLGQRPDPIPLLKALDLFVLSSWGEGMGSVLLEAAACGVPVAATTAGGIPEIIEDRATGRLVNARDPESLAAAILEMLGDPQASALMARNAREALPRYGLARMARQMEDVYCSL
jgi:glycosyltransferase involved in cell wall biosynthesis